MSSFEEFFAALEEKLKATSRIGLIQKANEDTKKQYKVNKLLYYWLSFKKFFGLLKFK